MTVHSRTILIADGHKLTGSLVEAALRRGGFLDIRKVDSGRQALALIQENDIRLLILDLDLPEMDGVQLLTHVQRRKQRKPACLVLTSFSLRFADRLREVAAAEVMAKPFDPLELCQRAEQLLSSERALVLDEAAFGGSENTDLSIEVKASLFRKSGLPGASG